MEKIRGPWAGPFWDGVTEGKIRFQRCNDCAKAFFPPQQFCAHCSSPNLKWAESKGQGSIYSFTTVFKGAPSEFADEVPYTVAVIQLDEGYRMSSRLVGRDHSDWACDQRVSATFAPVPTGTNFPFFAPLA